MTLISGSHRSSRAAWWRWNRRFLVQLLAGTLSHVARTTGSLDGAITRRFFAERRLQDDATVFDCLTDHYCSPLVAALADFDSEVLVDLGCGNGALYRCLVLQNVSLPRYIGLDFAATTTRLGENATIMSSDIRDLPPAIIEEKQSRTFTCVNSLCYIERLADVTLLAGGSRQGDTCLILEPHPGWFWDYSFDGIAPRYRRPNELARDLALMGWLTISVDTQFIFLAGRLQLFPVSYLVVAERA